MGSGFTFCLPASLPPNDEADKRPALDAAPIFLGDACSQHKKASGLRQSMSNSSFAHQLSHKISATLGNPTIVHRPKLRPGASLLSMKGDGVKKNPHEQVYSPRDSTAPSSFIYSGSISAGGYSTGKTSIDSNVASALSALQHDLVAKPSDHIMDPTVAGRERSLTPILEVPPEAPTILTVETAANAKIFFETHYDPILAGNSSPRSLRLRELESRLDGRAMPEEYRHLQRRIWANCESDHLRQIRVLKSKTNQTINNSGVALAGYEVVRILGKGSFGVVRLVREKEPSQATARHSASTAAQAWHQSAQGDLNRLQTSRNDSVRHIHGGQVPLRHPFSSTTSREVYAMKVIRKSDMLKNCQEGHLRAERDFLVTSEKSKWVVPLVASFQDDTNLYLVMEYMIGGDFLGLLFRRNVLKERHARWYVAEMILCIEETHRRNWIHRDIKPDNFLISSSGHLKISDFGLAFDGHWSHDQRFYKNHRKTLMEKLGIEVKGDREDQEEDANKAPKNNLASILTGRSYQYRENVQVDGPCEDESILQWRNREGKRRMAASVVGTSQYMAPEVIRGDPYDGRCDWWSIGIILYEVSI